MTTKHPDVDPADGADEPVAGDEPVAAVEAVELVDADPGADRVPVPSSIQTAASWSWRLLVIALATAALLFLIVELDVIVVPVAIALLFTVLLLPVRIFLERYLRFNRGAAAGTALVGTIIVVAALIAVAGRSIVTGFQDLADQAVAGFREMLDWVGGPPLNIDVETLRSWMDEAFSAFSSMQSEVLSGAVGAATTVGHVFAGIAIALFCTFFFLYDGRTIWSWCVGLLPVRSRDVVHQAARRGFVTLSAYARTQILVAFVDGVGIGTGAAILGVPLALPLGFLVFVGAFIPIVGAVLSGAVAVLIALVAKGWITALIMLGVVLLVQQIEGHVLQPFLMGHALSLHPVAVLLAVAAGAFTAGIVGALFAVPIVATLNTVVLYLHGHDKFPELGTADHAVVRGSPALPVVVRHAEYGMVPEAQTAQEHVDRVRRFVWRGERTGASRRGGRRSSHDESRPSPDADD
ncbi:AI-2E family transporter [Paraoerskovia marina]|uniref:AI-2E family transporter n=1 Tax=Paraoerskovia marina TaxID=545619 RepID=UPI0006931FAB